MKPQLQHMRIAIDEPHYQVHAARMYMISKILLSVANGADFLLLFITGDEEYHSVFELKSGGDARLFLLENPTMSASGTAIPIHNMHREFVRASGALAFISPTIATTGTVLFETVIPGGTGPQQSPGNVARPETEWIFDKNTAYIIFGINDSGSAQDMSAALEAYRDEAENN